MPGNGKLFVSHASADIPRCQPLLALLQVWGVDFWFDAQQMSAGEDLTQRIQAAIRERDIFVRICTPAAQQSYWVHLEASAARGLAAASPPGQRTFINLILDAAYQPEPFDHGSVVIDMVRQPKETWQRELRHALGVPESARQHAPKERKARPAWPRTPPSAPKRAALVPLIALVLLIAVAGVAFASGGAPLAFFARATPTQPLTATLSPTSSPTASPTPLLPATLASTATRGPFGLFTIRFPARWNVVNPGAQSYGMEASGNYASMDFSLADPNHADWSNDQWLAFMLENVAHTAFTKGTRTIGGIPWACYSFQEQLFPNDPSTIEGEAICFGRRNGNTYIIQLEASAPDFHAADVMYFTPSLRTFAFT
ncbi:MAG: hypothetical protein OJF49_003674 [Ktedonobacterales bacterium]|jgi:hypothetical protein|nr:MAG: hypothetical protein OJF49_003674 [Ktedonobacterales bacterium]